MALRRADRAHLAEVLAPEPQPATPAVPDPAPPAAPVPAAQPSAKPGERVTRVPARRPVRLVPTPPPSPTVQTAGTDEQAAPEATPTARVDHRGRKGLPYRWPEDDVEAVKDTCHAWTPRYQDLMRADGNARPWRITPSGLSEAAWQYALPHVNGWLTDAPNSGQSTKTSTADYVKIQLVWSLDSVAALDDVHYDLAKRYRSDVGGVLTKANLVLAAVRYALPHLEQWVASIPNDSRLAAPTATDRRVRKNKPAATD